MKAEFALVLSMDGLQYLWAYEGQWYELDCVDPEDPQIRSKFENMRINAKQHGANPQDVVLILPNEQIKYISTDNFVSQNLVDLNQIAQTTLRGATPYALSELRYDINQHGKLCNIAAVALETLQEAETFAKAQGFNPLASIAKCDENGFEVPAFFGLSNITSGLCEPLNSFVISPIAYELSAPDDQNAITPFFSTRSQRVIDPNTIENAPNTVDQSSIDRSTYIGAEISFTSRRNTTNNTDFSAKGRDNLKNTSAPHYRKNPNNLDKNALKQINSTSPKKTWAIFLVILLLGLVATYWFFPFLNKHENTPLPEHGEQSLQSPTNTEHNRQKTQTGPLFTPNQPDTSSTNAPNLIVNNIPSNPPIDPIPISNEEAEKFYRISGIWIRSPIYPSPPSQTELKNIYITSLDPAVVNLDAIALGNTDTTKEERALLDMRPPPENGTVFELDATGLVIATSQGALAPGGHRVFLGKPNIVPPLTPRQDEDGETVQNPIVPLISNASGTPLIDLRPQTRPNALLPTTIEDELRTQLSTKKPRIRPQPSDQEIAALSPSDQSLGLDEILNDSPTPKVRPQNLQTSIQSALQDVDEGDEANVSSSVPKIPSSARVSREATIKDAISLRDMNLLGVFGKSNNRRALVRLSNGRRKMVTVGDTLDGGRVAAIGEGELRYIKRGKNIILKIPKG